MPILIFFLIFRLYSVWHETYFEVLSFCLLLPLVHFYMKKLLLISTSDLLLKITFDFSKLRIQLYKIVFKNSVFLRGFNELEANKTCV